MLAEPRPRIVGVDNRLPDGRGRQALVKALEALSGVTPSESGHLVFAEAGQLDRAQPPGVWRVGFGRAPAAWLAKGEPHDFIGPFVLEKRHPLLLGITLGGVVWSGAVPLAAGAVRPLVSAGDQALVGMPDASAGTGTEPAILFNLDLDRTNLIRSPDWPILISNLVEMRRQSLPGPNAGTTASANGCACVSRRDPKGPLRLRCGAVERALAARSRAGVHRAVAGWTAADSRRLRDDRRRRHGAVRARRELPRRIRERPAGSPDRRRRSIHRRRRGCAPRAARSPIRCSGCC